TFVMALLSFGLGFYGLSVYVATLQRLHGWSASAVSAPVTMYYVAGAVLTAAIGDLYERFGPRAVVAGGSVAMAAGVAALGVVTQPWQLYPTFLVMSLGWGAVGGAGIWWRVSRRCWGRGSARGPRARRPRRRCSGVSCRASSWIA